MRNQPSPPNDPKPTRGDVESAIMDALGDARVLGFMMEVANESPRNEADGQGAMLVAEDAFLAWYRTCDNLIASVRKVEHLFYEAER